jgi:hypothetical protein
LPALPDYGFLFVGGEGSRMHRLYAIERTGLDQMTDERRAALLALAERCEAATGRDDLLALAIARATNLVTNAAPIGADGKGVEHFPDLTGSIDAALTLVPKGCGVSIWITPDAKLPGSAALRRYDKLMVEKTYKAAAATPALAICAAALRARAAQ